MSEKLIFFVPYHTGYAHAELIHSFASYTDVHLFVYKWNPAQERLKEYFASEQQIHLHEFSLDNLLTEFLEQKDRKVVVLLTASTNYLFGQIQLRFFRLLQQHIPTLIDVYPVGHCMYGCQSCAYAYTHCLPITFTNYLLTQDEQLHHLEDNFEILICPSYSFQGAPFSLLSNSDLIDYFLTLKHPHAIKLHPLAYEYEDKPWKHPFLSLTSLEKDHVKKLAQSKALLPSKYTNTLKLIEHARIIICDSNSSIPFEALYFQDGKYLFVYETINDYDEQDDRGKYFHKFHTVEQLKQLLDDYSNNRLECKTSDSHEFFLEKYLEPNGNEIEQLVSVRDWINDEEVDLNIDRETIKQAIDEEFQSCLTPMVMYTLGEQTIEEVIEKYFQRDEQLFDTLQDNVNEL